MASVTAAEHHHSNEPGRSAAALPVWRELAETVGLPQAAQAAVGEALAASGTAAQCAAFYARTDLTSAARIRMLQTIAPKEAAQLLLHDPTPSAEQIHAAVTAHGPTADIVIACAQHAGLHTTAAEVAGRLSAEQAIQAARRWPRREPMPELLHIALIDAMLADIPSRQLPEGLDRDQIREAEEAIFTAEQLWEEHVWELLEHMPNLWESLARQESMAGRHVQWLLLGEPIHLPDDVLYACLPAATHAWWGRDRRYPELTAKIRLCGLQTYVHRFPRLREIAQDWIDRTVADVLADGWSPSVHCRYAYDWDPVDALAEISRDPRHLRTTVQAVLASTAPDRRHRLESEEHWESRRATAANGLARNPCTPDAAVVQLLPYLDEFTIHLAAGRDLQALRRGCAAELTRRQSPDASSAERTQRATARTRLVPSDRTLSAQADPELDSVGDLGEVRLNSVVSGHARAAPSTDSAAEVSVVAPSPFW